MQIEWGKLLVLLTIVVGAVVLLALGRLSEVAGAGIIGTALGYVTGNGRLAAQGKPSVPAIGHRKQQERQ